MRFFCARDGFKMAVGSRNLESERALCWMNEADARSEGVNALAVYVEGNVTASSATAEVTSKKLFLVVRNSELL